MKTRIVLFLFVCLMVSACTPVVHEAVEDYSPGPLYFNEKGSFKIALFCDVHLHLLNSPADQKAKKLIMETLQSEKPDLAFFLGDALWSPSSLCGYTELATLCTNQRTPFTFVLGNHDRDGGLEGATIFHLLSQFPYFCGRSGPDTLSGNGNYDLPILDPETGKAAAVLYGLDSHDTGRRILDTCYEYIMPDQIHWYTQVSNAYTEKNGGKPLPSLMLFHIPLMEFATASANGLLTGIMGEPVNGPCYNSGLFDTMVEQNDVLAVFTGHDHDNNYLSELNGILLGYGNCTGYGSYGSIQRGVRMVELQKGEKSIHTYIRLDDGTLTDDYTKSATKAPTAF